MSGVGARQQWHTSHGSKSSKQSPKIHKFQGKKHPCKPLFIETKTLSLDNIITIINCMLVFDYPNNSLAAMLDLFKPFKEQQLQYQGSKETS